ncbi:rho guanine nucleotide exchange factor 18 isoform X4 [Lates japonicus]|uniref:Rho guanine nucleotide exchange factor 18 isoform X4 n=1 Tax=Lates japonicus TaxID=270547 RepID=A0AAD3M9S3_LATJO|nr:rho guanine nucleotide exchange factor 18 isoform X4 [Lates japonicus]
MFLTLKHHICNLAASECKPCSQPCGPPSAQLSVQSPAPSGKGSSSSLSPTSVAEDVFFGNTNDDQDTCSVVSDYDCPGVEVGSSVEDLLGFSSSLKDSEYFKDLEAGVLASQSTASTVTTVPESKTLSVGLQVSVNTDTPVISIPGQTSLTTLSPPVNAPSPPHYIQPAEEHHCGFVVTQLSPKLLPGCIIDSGDSLGPAVGLSLTINLNGLLGSVDTAKGITGSEGVKEQTTMDFDGEPDEDSFPILVRSMSTSRRHSWGVPVSPINLGRRPVVGLADICIPAQRSSPQTNVPVPHTFLVLYRRPNRLRGQQEQRSSTLKKTYIPLKDRAIYCAVNVHKSCKSLLGECTSSKNKRDTLPKPGSSGSPNLALKDRDRERDQAAPASSQTLDGHPSFLSAPGMTISQWGPNTQLTATYTTSSTAATASNLGHSLRHHNSSGSLPGEMDETDAFRFKRCNEDAISLAPSTTESIIVEDAHYAAVRADLESDAQDLEAESWSLAVDQQYVKRHSKETVKRQDVIYELMQTEMHHVRTLKIMLRVYVRELKENLQMDSGRLDCLFPRLENLLELHTHFLSCLKERRRENLVSPNDRNYTINRVADILITQFSGEIGERMKDSYGDFCSHHTEAVSYYKEQLQNNKKFQNIIRKINNLSIVRRLGVTECILLVTQRITKYPVLVERILHNTEEGTEEHEDLTRALGLIKDTIVQVDSLVNLYEKTSRLRDIHNKMEPKALGKIKDGRVFRREDLAPSRRRLLHEGTVNWKAASGRLKDILAVLLSDVLLLLQEKDQRYVFATVDNKPSVISLQKLIVREVAHEEKAMFLICASSNEPEMYEIHTTSKEERNTWMTHIRQAVESCPHTEERLFSEEEEARASRFKEFQERLGQKDAVIVQALTEKLQLFADMAESVAGLEDTASRSRLLLRGDASDLQQGETLLKGAITEVENLQNLLQSGVREEVPTSRLEEGGSSGVLPRRVGTFGGYDSSPTILNKNGSVKKNSSGESRNRDRSQRASSDPQLKDLCGSHTLEQTVDESSPARWNRIWSNSFPEAEFFDRVLMLSQRLYSLQAIISQQDSHIELQRASLTERASLPGRHRGNVLLEQEKQRTLALQREELASFHKLQSQHRQEQQRWEKERERHRQQVEATEARLRQREEECKRLEEHLAKEKEELDRQRETYQQDLERLRESTRAVEKEKERLEHQKKIKRKTIEVAPLSGSLNGELLMSSGLTSSTITSDLPPPQKPLVRASLSVAPADYPERRGAAAEGDELHLATEDRSATPPLQHHQPAAQTGRGAAADPYQAGCLQ